MKQLQYVVSNHIETLNYLKSRFPLYHSSNVFFRDIQYGVRSMLEGRGVGVSYTEAEKIAHALIEKLEKEKILARLDHQTWVLRFPEFRTPQVAPKAGAQGAPKVSGSSAPVGGALPGVKQAAQPAA